MEEITVSAKTLDDAITEASVQLGVTSDKLEYDVIEKGSPGFLGIGMRQAVIKAWKKKDVSEPEVRQVQEEKSRKEKRAKENETVKEQTAEISAAEKEEEIREVKKENKNRNDVELAKVEDHTVEVCEEFLYQVMKAMRMDVEINSRIDEEGALAIEMSGKNMGILIGKRGQTLDSLQYLTNRVANKTQDGYVRVKLDTEDYRRRRKETLENLAKNIAHKVKKTRRAVSLEPMNPYERRIIHSALQSDRSVTTHSEGEEPYRRVVVTLVRR